MQKRAIWAVLGAMLAVMVASITLVFTVGRKTNADSEPTVGILKQESYFKIGNISGTLEGLSNEGKAYASQFDYFKVIVPSWVYSIGTSAFLGYTNLTSIIISNSVTSINHAAFKGCTGLTSIEIPSSVTNIGSSAFSDCTELTSIEIPSGVTSIGSLVFSGCTNLSSITVDQNNTMYTSRDNNNNEVNAIITHSGYLVAGCKNTIISSNITTIGNGAFMNCTGLTSIEIPSNVTSISNSAFWGCTGLISIEIPSSVEDTGAEVFAGWTGGQTIYCEIESEPSSWSSYWLDGCSANVEWGNVPVYTVTFDANGGREVRSRNIIDGCCILGASTFKEYHDFIGWYLNGVEYDFDTPVTADITLVAQWEIYHYWVHFDSNGGSEIESQYVAHGETATEPTAPTLEGYHFVKWYTIVREMWGRGEWREYEEDFDFDEPITEEITLYAKWAINLYTVTFETNGGTLIDSQVVSHGEIAEQPDDPERTGHIFKGWYTDNTYSTEYDFDNAVVSNLRIYAKWQAETYTVTLMDGDSKIEDKIVDYGTLVASFDEPTKTGHNFIGWYLDGAYETAFNIETPITTNTTLYAKWSVGQYMVNFMTDGGSLVDSQTVVYEGYATRPVEDPTKVGHTFAGWYASEALTEEFDFTSTPIVANTEIYAKWEAISYTVTFEVNGTIVDIKSVKYGSLVDAPEVQAVKGYPFVGWYNTATNKIFDVETLPITGDLNLRATWGVFFVDFETNGGTKVQSMAVNENSKLEKPENPTQEGYTFAGWYTDKSLTNKYDFNNEVTENMTLYAKWETVPAESGVNVAAVAGAVAGGVAGVGALSSILAVVIRRRRKL